MTEDEYTQFFEQLLRAHGGSLDSPSGWGEDGKTLYYSCTMPPIDVPLASTLDHAQRKVIVERARKKYCG